MANLVFSAVVVPAFRDWHFSATDGTRQVVDYRIPGDFFLAMNAFFGGPRVFLPFVNGRLDTDAPNWPRDPPPGKKDQPSFAIEINGDVRCHRCGAHVADYFPGIVCKGCRRELYRRDDWPRGS